MKRIKKCCSVVCFIVLMSVSGITTFAENTEGITIKNLNFDIPLIWEYLDMSQENNTALYTYSTSSEVLFINDMKYEEEYDQDVVYLYDALVGVAAYGFEDEDGYIPVSENKYEIDSHRAQENKFLCNLNGVTYYFEILSVNTDFSVVDFIYRRQLESESVGIDAYREMINEMQIGETNSSSDQKYEYTKYASGVYKVGTDIPSGEYVVFASGGMGYFCVSSDSNQDDIIFNENFDYNSIISINNGEYLDLTRCYAIPFNEDPEIETNGEGMFKVGVHIPSGEYKIESTGGMGYYCIYPDSRQDDIISNDNFDGQNYVTVSDGQYLVLNRCKFSVPPEKPIRTYTDSETVKKVQEALNAEGYDCGTPDGIAGSGTKAAIEKYQTDNGLYVNGTITDEVLSSLGIE